MLITMSGINSGAQLADLANIPVFKYRRWQAGKKGFLLRLRRRPMQIWINWGLNPVALARVEDKVLNKMVARIAPPQTVLNRDNSKATSKRTTYKLLGEAGISTPVPFESVEAAIAAGVPYLGRMDGMKGGEGIVLYQAGEKPAVKHDFVVPFLALKHEFRIHVWRGAVVATQYKKLLELDVAIRNHDNGVRFVTWPLEGYIGEQTTVRAKAAAIKAVETLGLDFGAVDLAIELTPKGNNRLMVLEVNTAPGVQAGSTIEIYKNLLMAVA
jgi:hypothetical protein